ncbi:MAG TPA: thiamine pyrophosphate-dependent dehydrogenase E1 component subunit alpha [Anaerolineae bacterium]|nr:thiamine pyrophosphate-dependent dehydrogenase E1 component subunit alpha [Anaerolineae bacterium]HQH37342.1 thiamine pyrophosphate-dependent dehydrogenase E1 component subunit alpha [Anaerolineae bacterium]
MQTYLSIAPGITTAISAAELRSMYIEMLRIREAEERLADMIAAGEIRCPVHLYIGQEAVAVGVCKALETTDYIFGGHRSHGHYLAKGGDLRAMVAEILGKETGCSKGRGGSMHVAAPEVGLPGTSAMVGTGIPLAVGAAIAFAMQRTSRVAAVFFGDGATEEGGFYESLNLAALRKAPVIFVCENNLYSSHIHIRDRRPADNLDALAAVHSMPAVRIDGNDVVTVYQTAREAVTRARQGHGPTFIECRTYRWRGHVGPNYDIDKGLRSQEELSEWQARCPIHSLEARLLNQGILTDTEVTRLRQAVMDEVAAAIAFARQSPYPNPDTLSDYVFAQ